MAKEDAVGTISLEQRVADSLVVPLVGMGDANAIGNEARLETIPRVIRDHSRVMQSPEEPAWLPVVSCLGS